MDKILYKTNEYQTAITEDLLSKYPDEVKEELLDVINTVPMITTMVSSDRKRAKDLPRDKYGRIIVDVTQPHILEDMEYFRPVARLYEETGKLCPYKPNRNPNSEFYKWCKREYERCYYGMVRESDGEWIPGDLYFFWNYCPILVSEKKNADSKMALRKVAFPFIFEGHYLKYHYIEQSRQSGKHGFELAGRGCGKAENVDTIIDTPNGKRRFGDLQIGDFVFDDTGKKTKIIDIPFNDVCDFYEVQFMDGRKVECSSGHLWTVYNCDDGSKIDAIETIELFDIYKSKGKRKKPLYSVPHTPVVEINKEEIGAARFIGNILGNTNLVNDILIPDDEDDVFLESINNIGDDETDDDSRLFIDALKDIKQIVDLCNVYDDNICIPDEIKYSNIGSRIDLLNGLFDSSGDIINGNMHIRVNFEKLAEDILWIARSIGFNGKIKTVQNESYKYDICIYRFDEDNKNLMTGIKSISYIGKKHGMCISVENENGLYLTKDFIVTHNSFTAAAMLAKRFLIGQDFGEEYQSRVNSSIVASGKEKLVGGDQTLDKFQYYIDFNALKNPIFPNQRSTNRLNDMIWVLGYKTNDSPAIKGLKNSVVGYTAKDDPAKIRGSRATLYILEEAGSFPHLRELYQNLRPSVENGEDVFGMIYCQGTSGDNESDFAGALELMNNPDGYNLYGLNNVYDKIGQGKRKITFFYPAYINRANCFDKNGNSDVVKALLEILMNRWMLKYNSNDPGAIVKETAERPITPREATIKIQPNMFPSAELNERILELDSDPNILDNVYIGTLVIDERGDVQFRINDDTPIREFPLSDNKEKGALEIFEMPQKNSQGNVPVDRYIIGYDPVDADESATMSLSSIFVFDLWKDNIVAEYTGRMPFVEDTYELVRKLCLFYNAKCMYENNLRGTYAYFLRMNCTYLLADTPEYLKDRELIKISYSNVQKGVRATKPINDFANQLIKTWLLTRYTKIVVDEQGEEHISTVPNVFKVKNRALLRELICYTPNINVDRIRALGILMIYREEFMIRYGGSFDEDELNQYDSKSRFNDEFFKNNYDDLI